MADIARIGNVEIVSVLDMVPPPRDPAAFFPDVSKEDWAPYESDVLENGQLQLYFGCFFVRSQGKVIMVDTGMGPGPHRHLGNLTGDLLNRLKQQSVDADDVDLVVHTHLHSDHVGWNLDRAGQKTSPYFPRARYLVPRLDWEHFTQADVLKSAAHVTDNVLPLEQLGIMDLIESEHNVTDELSTLATPGHTPGHQAILISSQGEKAMIVGDVLHNKVQIQEAEWCAGVDIDKPQSRQSREKLLSLAEQEGYVVAAAHFHPNDHLGRVVRLEGRRYWQVLQAASPHTPARCPEHCVDGLPKP